MTTYWSKQLHWDVHQSKVQMTGNMGRGRRKHARNVLAILRTDMFHLLRSADQFRRPSRASSVGETTFGPKRTKTARDTRNQKSAGFGWSHL